jgi:fluoroquinolone transport system ATP-binding protein
METLERAPMIEVSDLSFVYAGASQPAVRTLEFAVEPGEIFGFLGPSGAGKSTTQKVLTGLLKNYQGSAKVFGRDLATWAADYYERIGVSFELPNHYLKLTGAENLRYFGSLYRKSPPPPERLLEAVGLSDSADIPVGQYSKGMKTRLGVVRALQHEPELLFLDEPTAGLDPASARTIKSLIRERQDQGATVFLTTHDMGTVDELCDRAAFIVDGQIALIDRPREMKLRYGKRRLRVEYLEEGSPQVREFDVDDLGNNSDFLELLRAHDVQTLHTQEASLDEIFIQVTGKSLS